MTPKANDRWLRGMEQRHAHSIGSFGPMTFDDVLTHLLHLVGREVDVRVSAASEFPSTRAIMVGRLVRVAALEPELTIGADEILCAHVGEGTFELERPAFDGGVNHHNGEITFKLGDVVVDVRYS